MDATDAAEFEYKGDGEFLATRTADVPNNADREIAVTSR